MHAHICRCTLGRRRSSCRPPQITDLCPAAPTHAPAAKGRADPEHPRDTAGALRGDAARPAPLLAALGTGGSASSPSRKQGRRNSERRGFSRACPPQLQSKARPQGHAAAAGREESGLKGAIRYHLPVAAGSSRQRPCGAKRALERSAASLGAIFPAVFKKMRGNDMGNVRNKARSN